MADLVRRKEPTSPSHVEIRLLPFSSFPSVPLSDASECYVYLNSPLGKFTSGCSFATEPKQPCVKLLNWT